MILSYLLGEGHAGGGVLAPHQPRAPVSAGPGNKPLHLHPLFNTIDVLGDGKPTAAANAESGGPSLLRSTASLITAGMLPAEEPVERPRLPVVESLAQRTLTVPWFKHDRPEEIAAFAAAYIKVARAFAKQARDPRE